MDETGFIIGAGRAQIILTLQPKKLFRMQNVFFRSHSYTLCRSTSLVEVYVDLLVPSSSTIDSDSVAKAQPGQSVFLETIFQSQLR